MSYDERYWKLGIQLTAIAQKAGIGSPTLHSLPVIPVQMSKLVFSLPSLDSRIRALD